MAIIGTWISNPMTYLPLYWFNYEVGCLLLGDNLTQERLNGFQQGGFWSQGLSFSMRLFIGSAIVGVIFSLITGLACYIGIKRSKKHH